MGQPNAAADCSARSGRCQRGFTLIELVTVIIIVGILAVVVAPRFADKTFDQRGFHDAVQAAIQHARRSAVASRRYECVKITKSTGIVEVTRDTNPPEAVLTAGTVNCTQAISLPSPGRGCATNQVCAPTGVALGGTVNGVTLAGALDNATLIFDPQGRLVTAPNTTASTAATITITGASDITVLPETGYTQ
jgi:MSHA pilin protein MshC